MPGDIDNEGVRQYIRVDRVNYSDGSHPENCPGLIDLWPIKPDGDGMALTRKVPTDYGNDPDNWTIAAPSPGEPSVFTEEPSVEGFETGDFSRFDWVSYGDADWIVTSDEHNSGTYSARAGSIDDNESTTLEVTLDCISGEIGFCYKVSSEQYYDYLRFYIDGTQQDQWSGNEDWTQVSFPVSSGRRTFEWTYSKDGSSSDGSDTAWIDDIVFPVEVQTNE
jgi:hypothetical protein